jgi:hypothetical protein
MLAFADQNFKGKPILMNFSHECEKYFTNEARRIRVSKKADENLIGKYVQLLLLFALKKS